MSNIMANDIKEGLNNRNVLNDFYMKLLHDIINDAISIDSIIRLCHKKGIELTDEKVNVIQGKALSVEKKTKILFDSLNNT